MKNIKELIAKHRKEWLNDYLTFLKFPSVSSEPAYKKPLMECADWVMNFLKKIGFTVELWPTSGHPTIFASYTKAGKDKPTLLIYNHYDVQPVDPENEWSSPPFSPTIVGQEVYARGAQDNKGQCFYVMETLKLILEQTGELPINIKLCIEGEEEIGSNGLSGILQDKKAQLKADYLAIIDVGTPGPNIPSVTLGTRGIITMDLEVKSADTDLHSGFHGGIMQNPIHVLSKLLADLHDANGKVTIPGFYDQVVEMSAEEKAQAYFKFDEEDYKKVTGATPNGGEKGYTPIERSCIRPTLEINGICGGYYGDGFKTVIPAKAHAKISCRLVPNQSPDEIGRLVADYLKKKAPEGVEVKVVVHKGKGKAVRVSQHSKVVRDFAQAFTEVLGSPCEYIYAGGSIPIVPELAEACGGEVILLGLGLVSDQIHAPNEHFGIDRIEKGIEIVARALELLAK